MRFSAPIATSVLFIALVFSVMMGRSYADGAVELADAKPDKVMIVSYQLTGLPVWSQDGEKFDPSILIAFLKASVDADAWDGSSRMIPHAEKHILLVVTTRENHRSIQAILERLRKASRNSNSEQ